MNRKLKEKAIKYMGGKCRLCEYNRCARSLHFHHLNSFEKDASISEMVDWPSIKLELEKCILLCANCHGEVHSGLIDQEVIAMLAEV